MKTLSANVYGKEYTLACDSGQEQHLQHLVAQVNTRTERLEKAVGKLPDPMMLLYTSLMLADELHDATRENARLRDELARSQRHMNEAGDDARIQALEEEMAGHLHELAARLEGLAIKLTA